jgi:F-type H+-transporting ATPase subunit b
VNIPFADIASITIANVSEPLANSPSDSQGGQTLLGFNITSILVIISLLILYYALNKLLFSKFTPFMEKRAAGIKESLEEAENAKIFAKELKAEYSEKIKKAQSDIEQMLEDAKTSAKKEYEAIIKDAKLEAMSMLSKAHAEIEKEHEKMIQEIKSEVASIAIAAASKLIETNLDTATNKKLVEKFVNEVGVA